MKSQAKDSFKVIFRFLRTALDWKNKAVRKTQPAISTFLQTCR